MCTFNQGRRPSDKTKTLFAGLRSAFDGAGWGDHWPRLWALGPRHVGANLFFTRLPFHYPPPDWIPLDLIRDHDAENKTLDVVSSDCGAASVDYWAELLHEMEGSLLAG